jgi:outer membrane protein assembly factor BamD
MYDDSQKQIEVIAKAEAERQKLKESQPDPATKPAKVTTPAVSGPNGQ